MSNAAVPQRAAALDPPGSIDAGSSDDVESAAKEARSDELQHRGLRQTDRRRTPAGQQLFGHLIDADCNPGQRFRASQSAPAERMFSRLTDPAISVYGNLRCPPQTMPLRFWTPLEPAADRPFGPWGAHRRRAPASPASRLFNPASLSIAARLEADVSVVAAVVRFAFGESEGAKAGGRSAAAFGGSETKRRSLWMAIGGRRSREPTENVRC